MTWRSRGEGAERKRDKERKKKEEEWEEWERNAVKMGSYGRVGKGPEGRRQQGALRRWEWRWRSSLDGGARTGSVYR